MRVAENIKTTMKKKFKIGNSTNIEKRLTKNGKKIVFSTYMNIHHYLLLVWLANQGQMTASTIVEKTLERVFAKQLAELRVNLEESLNAGMSLSEFLPSLRKDPTEESAKETEEIIQQHQKSSVEKKIAGFSK